MALDNLNEYIEKCRALGYRDQDIRETLKKHGWEKQDIDITLKNKAAEPRRYNIVGYGLAAIIILLIVSLIAFIILFVYHPSDIPKPIVQQPSLTGQAISNANDAEYEQQLEYLFNEVGAYKLKDSVI